MFISKVGEMFAQATSNLKNPSEWLVQMLGGGESSSGIPITMRSVLGIPEVFNAVSKISGHLAQMPIYCKEMRDYKEMPFPSDFGAKAIRNPNEFFTKFTLFEKVMLDALLYGNGRAYIERNSLGQPIGLLPIQAEDTTTVVADGERWHLVSINDGTAVGTLKTEAGNDRTMYRLPDRDVLLVMGLSRNGWWGESLLDIMRDQFGLAIAGAEASGSTFRNAGRPGLLLEAPRGAFRTAKEAQDFLDQFNEAHEGLDNTGKTGMIREGMKAQVLPHDTNSTGYVSQRQFGRESQAIIFLLETVLGDNSGGSYKSVTERQSAYLTNCLGRWIAKIESECDLKLLSKRQRSAGTFRYCMEAKSIYSNNLEFLASYTSTLRQQGVISGNEVRAMHGMNPVDGLDDDYYAGSGNIPQDNDLAKGSEEPETQTEEEEDEV
ncbi:phage portal protein [bacterium]|nr:phage portal protein [bacterium]